MTRVFSSLRRPLAAAMMAVGLFVGLALASAMPAQAQKPAQPGHFDYYVLALSWSPNYCAAKGSKAVQTQCGPDKNFGFVIHGLWPQFERGGYPANCSTTGTVPPSVVEALLPYMPDEKLIQHEWRTHGTCSGEGPDEFFADTRAAAERIKIPENLRVVSGSLSMEAQDVAAAFLATNSQLTPDMLRVICDKNQVTEVRVCLNNDLDARVCGPDVVNTCSSKAKLVSK